MGKIQLMTIRNGIENQRSIGKYSTHNMSRYALEQLALLMVGILLTCSIVAAAPLPQRITIETFFPYYSPTLLQIGLDTTITWENPTSNLHTITHDACKTNEKCAFDSGPIGPQQTFTVQKLPAGSYPYHCSLHPIMRGVLVVEEANFLNEI